MPKAPSQEDLSIANILLEPGTVNGSYLMGGEDNGSCQHHKAMSDSSSNGILSASTLTSHDISRILKQQKESTTKLVLYHKYVALHSFLLDEKKSWESYFLCLHFFQDCVWCFCQTLAKILT